MLETATGTKKAAQRIQPGGAGLRRWRRERRRKQELVRSGLLPETVRADT